MARHTVIPHDDPKYPAIRRRMIETWLKTILGYLAMGGLCVGAFYAFGATYRFQFGFGLLWIFLPVVMWWFCAKIAIAMTKSVPADPNNPQHKRVLDCVDRVFAQSGMKYKPPVYASPNPLPNAFATGPIHRKAVVAFTEGLLNCDMTDAEIEAVFAHELGHVKNYDVGINSMLAMLSSIFFLIVEGGVRILIGSIGLFKRVLGIRPTTRFIPALITNVIMYVVFWATGQLTRVVQFFVVRSRESGADATAAYMLGKPCDLSTALQKIVRYFENNRPASERESVLLRVFRPIMIADPLFDTLKEEPRKPGLWAAIKRLWKYLQLTHPPVPERTRELERMNGGACPRI